MLDADEKAAVEKTHNAPGTYATSVDVAEEIQRKKWISEADIVISLLPPALHYLVAKDCIVFSKNLLTASYVDAAMKDLAQLVKEKGLFFLCEMGLDPGIDHMSAMKIVHSLQKRNLRITSFRSHCGGLVAPESDDNLWRYKISWNPRNVVLAGKAGAIFRENNQVKKITYENLFNPNNVVDFPGVGLLSWYPNRDSLGYIVDYGLDDVFTFIRTTLRYPDFSFGWNNVIQLKLTDETPVYDTDGMSLRRFFQIHLQRHGFSEWVEKQLTSKFMQTKLLLEKLQQLLDAEEDVDADQMKELQEFMMVNPKGKLLDVNLEEVKTQAAATVAGQMHEANLSIKQLFFLGMDDSETIINKGRCSAADVLQFALEKKLQLKDSDKDMIVMLHEIDYEENGKSNFIKSSLVVKGENNTRTAMAKTVGLPLGIAATLILQGKINLTGLHIPILPEIYEPVLKELESFGILFEETIM